MPNNILKIIFLIGFIISSVIRAPYTRRKISITYSRATMLDKLLLIFTFLGMFLLPIVYVITQWLNFANYQIPIWAGCIGVSILTFALWLFWRAHVDLGNNWLLLLQIRKEHKLITKGVFQYIRHPMYASLWLWCIAQPLLIQNWIAGWSGLVSFLPIYILRIKMEEKMMKEYFGEAYLSYINQTGRVIPRFSRNRKLITGVK
jgi:protein-S-isoprenylcysteine O-methyltransferase Ste14